MLQVIINRNIDKRIAFAMTTGLLFFDFKRYRNLAHLHKALATDTNDLPVQIDFDAITDFVMDIVDFGYIQRLLISSLQRVAVRITEEMAAHDPETFSASSCTSATGVCR